MLAPGTLLRALLWGRWEPRLERSRRRRRKGRAELNNTALPRSISDRVVFPASCESRHTVDPPAADDAPSSGHDPRPGFSSGNGRLPETFLGSSRLVPRRGDGRLPETVLGSGRRVPRRAAGGRRRRQRV